jgi:hypothetical protein
MWFQPMVDRGAEFRTDVAHRSFARTGFFEAATIAD